MDAESRRSAPPRRRFVQAAVAGGLGLAAIAARFRHGGKAAVVAFGRRRFPEPALDQTRPTGVLTESELPAIVALAEVLISPERWPGAGLFVEHVTRQTTSKPGYLDQYRAGVGILNDAARRSHTASVAFDKLSREAREAVLSGLLWRYRADERVTRWLERMFVSERLRAFRRFVVTDLLVAFYCSAHGWAVVGYTHHPGVPAADPFDYTRPVNRPRPRTSA